MKSKIIIGIVAAVAVLGGGYTVSRMDFIGTGKVGIVYNYKDGVQDTVLTPGMHFIAPMNKVKEFSTKKKMRFIYQMLFRSAFVYQANLRLIDKKRIEIEERVDGDTSDTDLIELHELESTLVYFATSLRANSIVLERLRRYKRLEQYPEDMELLEDVMVEYQQAIEMTTIYRDVIDGTRELMSSVIDSKLNNVMKYLTSITIVMAIPTIISGIYGMNVGEEWMPFAKTPFGFEIISGVMLIICIIVLWVLRKKKML